MHHTGFDLGHSPGNAALIAYRSNIRQSSLSTIVLGQGVLHLKRKRIYYNITPFLRALPLIGGGKLLFPHSLEKVCVFSRLGMIWRCLSSHIDTHHFDKLNIDGVIGIVRNLHHGSLW